MKYEGFWYSKYEPNWPKPVPDVLTDEQALKVYNRIKQKEKTARATRYRGWSTSRIDGTHVGCTEYESGGWRWPEAFAPHYVLKYKVKPSDEFLKFLKVQL